MKTFALVYNGQCYDLTNAPFDVAEGMAWVEISEPFPSWGDTYTEGVFSHPPAPVFTPEQQQAALTLAVQSRLDAAARAKGYDSILSAVSYVVADRNTIKHILINML
jgi:hypothetical protein